MGQGGGDIHPTEICEKKNNKRDTSFNYLFKPNHINFLKSRKQTQWNTTTPVHINNTYVIYLLEIIRLTNTFPQPSPFYPFSLSEFMEVKKTFILFSTVPRS